MFSTPVSVTKGTLYWALFRNTSPSPSRNYTSANATLQRPTLVPRQPRQTDREYIVGYFDSSGSWTERAGYTAIIDIGYADDSHSGQGYMEFWVHPGQHAEIGGSHRVRENLSNPISRAVRTLAARIERVSGSGPLTIALYSDATLIADGTVSASVVARSPVGTDGGLTWAIVELPAPVTLPAGPATLVLTAPSGTTYSTFGIRKGGLFGYTAGATYFAYGSGQYSTDGSSSWNDFNDLANGSDVQFYLR
ncbi:MAG TPA: hypothetical protein VJZ72_10405 [Candidatus Limnocylindrales bacterium]|nr:hypothetical protein [Candidatus Limnocylindrales bacterium]